MIRHALPTRRGPSTERGRDAPAARPTNHKQEPKPDPNNKTDGDGGGGGRPVIGASTRAAIHQVGPTCSLWSVQQVQYVSLTQQQQQADMPCFSCCFQR